MIVVTGGAGFIGSNLIESLNKDGITDIIVVDKFTNNFKNLLGLKFKDFVEKYDFINNIDKYNFDVIIHLGACTNTQEYDVKYMLEHNYVYSKKLYDYCLENNKRLIYASSAAVYGEDNKPLNVYGFSKLLFDNYVDIEKLPQCVGLRFFNVYGKNEGYKGQMASVIYHFYNQIKDNGEVNLFKSYKKEYKHGEQVRDFIYINDVVKIIKFFLNNKKISGICDVGTGKNISFNVIARVLFKLLNKKEKINYIEMPDRLKNKYQYHTLADISDLRIVGYNEKFYTIVEGIKDYLKWLK